MALDLTTGLTVIKRVRQAGVITAAQLGATPGWHRVKAHIYLTALTNEGFLERVGDKKPLRYVLGREALNLAPDFRL